jgi:sensor domain CHASE-containing protein
MEILWIKIQITLFILLVVLAVIMFIGAFISTIYDQMTIDSEEEEVKETLDNDHKCNYSHLQDELDVLARAINRHPIKKTKEDLKDVR